MKFERTKVFNFENAFYGMRNPKKSWDLSDSFVGFGGNYVIGPKDMQLAQKLIAGGPEHRKFMRQIFVSVQITAPIYFWKELDTYKVGTTRNSTSTMHTLSNESISIDLFEIDDYENIEIDGGEIDGLLSYLEQLRVSFNETKDRKYWKELIRWLPESFLQSAMLTLTYENLYNIVHQRKGHKLSEWKSFLNWASNLPYAKDLIFYEKDKEDRKEPVVDTAQNEFTSKNNDLLKDATKNIEKNINKSCKCKEKSCDEDGCETCKSSKEASKERDLRIAKEIYSAIDEIIKELDQKYRTGTSNEKTEKTEVNKAADHKSPTVKKITLTPEETEDLFDFLFSKPFRF